MTQMDRVLDEIRKAASEADDLHARSRAMLTEAVRKGARAGLTQRQIAEAVGRSQPEVSRLLRFHGSSEQARALSKSRGLVVDLVHANHGRDPLIFGSVATKQAKPGSDIDMLVTFDQPPSLLALARLEKELGRAIGYPVDVTPLGSLPEHMRKRVEREAVPL